ncbi:MAG: DNA-binding protein [Thermoprotei archaeon]|nr:MAG: DNA-binding protein [Thermoprotei archaeon]
MSCARTAEACVKEALRRLETARGALSEGAHAYCIRQSQEAVELSLKAVLRLVGVEPPKWHDVGPVLIEFEGRFPDWFRREMPQLAATSKWHRREREPSMCGDEELGLSPDRLYTEPYARRALEEAEHVCKVVRKLLKSLSRSSP